MSYDERYRTTANVFGSEPEAILTEYCSMLDRSRSALDLGAGQGRNAIFLARKGFDVEAIDPSPVAADTIRAAAAREELPIRAHSCGFEDFSPEPDSFSGVLAFGLTQILPWESINLLVNAVNRWLHPGGMVFITAFSAADDGYKEHSTNWKEIGRNSFSGPDGDVRTYLEPDELPALFPEYESVHNWAGLGPEHHHGDGQMERHALIEAVLRR